METAFNLEGQHFHFALPCYDGKLHTETALGLIESSSRLTAMGLGHRVSIIRSGSLIDQTRNELVDRFLQDEKSTVMVFIDSDISFNWENMLRLLAFSTEYPIISGAYPNKKEPTSFTVNWMDNKLNKHGLLPVHSMGIGFTAIQRQVFEKLDAEPYYHKKLKRDLKAYFQCKLRDGVFMGEDIFFFDSVVKAGFQPYIDPRIELGHMGYKEYFHPFKDVLPELINDERAVPNWNDFGHEIQKLKEETNAT